MITQSQLKSIVEYDPVTGVFTWVNPTSNRVKKGALCNCVGPLGYVVIGIEGKRRYAHRLAWLYFYGDTPANQIDHINGNRSDNRIENLRLATKTENMRNVGLRSQNTSGCTGVSFHKATGKWRAFVNENGRFKHVGVFSSFDDAKLARDMRAKDTYGEFFKPS